MNIFGMSVAARYRELFGEKVEFPEQGYRGAYIKDIAAEIAEKDGDAYLSLTKEEETKFFADLAYRQVLAHLEKTLKRFGIVFDNWFSERTLHEENAIIKAIEKLQSKDFVYKSENAVWLKTTAFGDEKDRVLIKEDGQPTYFAADIAYHLNKLERGFSKVIDIWGADHHGYVARMKASMKALGASDDFLEIIIGQLVNLIKGGKPVRMSKRTGEMVTFEELIDEVGVDAARFFFLSRTTDTPLEFDIDLAKKHSSENPVFYVQYAHARICSILRTATERGVDLEAGKEVNYRLLTHTSEIDLISAISRFPEVIKRAAEERAPQRLTKYAHQLAEAFHIFYTNCRVIAEQEDIRLSRANLLFCAQITLQNCLDIMGISAPERM
jgi:arginyl-tRNA synthetase